MGSVFGEWEYFVFITFYSNLYLTNHKCSKSPLTLSCPCSPPGGGVRFPGPAEPGIPTGFVEPKNPELTNPCEMELPPLQLRDFDCCCCC